MPSMVSFLSNWRSTNYEMAIENRFFCQPQLGQVCSQTLKSIITVERGREVNSSRGTSGKACWRIHSKLQIVHWGLWPRTLDSAAIRTIFQIQFQNTAVIFYFFFPGHARNLSRSFLTKLYLPVSLWKENKMKKQQLEIAFYSDGHLGSEALLPIRKVPPLLFLYPLSLSRLYSFTPSTLLYQSHCFCCALQHSHKLTCWILNWDIKLQGSSIQRKLFYILPPLEIVYVHHLVDVHTQSTSAPHLKSATSLRREKKKPFSSWDQKTDEANSGFSL